MRKSKKWSVIALASVVLVSVAYFGSTGQTSRLGSSALTTTNTCTESAHAAQAAEYTTKVRLKAEYVAQVAALIQSNNNLSSQARSTRNKISDYQNQINDIQKKINPLKKYLDEKCSLPTRLRPSDCTNKKNQLNNLYDDIEHRNSRIKDLQKDVKRFDSTVARDSGTISSLNSSIASLATFITSYEKCDAELKNSVCNNLAVSPTNVISWGTITYSCIGTNPSEYRISVKKPDGTVLSTLNTAIWSFLLPQTPTGTYTIDCYINWRTTTPAECSKTVTVNSASPTPSIVIDKRDANSADLDGVIGNNDSQTITAGNSAAFKIRVTNNGTEDLKNLNLIDSIAPNCAWVMTSPSLYPSTWSGLVIAGSGNHSDAILQVGEYFEYVCNKGNTTENYTNSATVSAQGNTSGVAVTSTDNTLIFVQNNVATDIEFARDTSVALSQSYIKGTNDVTLAKGTITTKTPINLEDIVLDYTSNVGANMGASDGFGTVYLQIGSSVLTWTADATGAADFNGLATVSGTADFRIWAKIKDTATLTSFKFEDFDLSDVTTPKYVSNQNTVTSWLGSIPAVEIGIGFPSLAVTRTDGLGATTIAPGSTGLTVNALSLAVSLGNDLIIATPVYTITSDGTLYQNHATATLYIDGVAVSTKTITGSTVSFDANRTITKAPKTMFMKVDFSSAFNTGTFSMKLTGLNITDALTSTAILLPVVPDSAVFTIGPVAGTASISDLNPDPSVILGGSRDQKILAFRVSAENDNIKLRDLDFDGRGLDNLSNFRLLTPTGAYFGATSNSATHLVFSNLPITDTVPAGKTDTYYLVADTNTNVDGAAFSATLDTSESQIKTTDGTVFSLAGFDILSANHLIVANKAVVAKAVNASKALTTSALRFTVSASGKDSVTLNSLSFNNIFSGYTTSSAKIVIYKNSISAANKAGQTTAGTFSGTIALTANNTIDTGVTNTYIVVIEGAVVDSTGNGQDWIVTLSDVNFDHSVGHSINVSGYLNLGDLPITEVK